MSVKFQQRWFSEQSNSFTNNQIEWIAELAKDRLLLLKRLLFGLNFIYSFYTSEMETALVDVQVLLEKFPGKGGWTYARVPGILPDKKNWFNWVKVKGSIDEFYFTSVNLMPMGNGWLFLPVKKEVRKIINKEAGDYVHIILYKDNDPVHIPGELLECLRDEPKSQEVFLSLTDNDQSRLIKWIYNAKLETTRIERIAELVEKLKRGSIP